MRFKKIEMKLSLECTAQMITMNNPWAKLHLPWVLEFSDIVSLKKMHIKISSKLIIVVFN